MTSDWNQVVAMSPHGYAEFQDHENQIVIHGPVESVTVDEMDMVCIKLKWAAQMGLLGTSTLGPYTKVCLA
jgi:hypothetical protein